MGMKLTSNEGRELARLYDALLVQYKDLECIQTETDEGRPYILLSQPAEGYGGVAAIFIQPTQWQGWQVWSEHRGAMLAEDSRSLTQALVKARQAVLACRARASEKVTQQQWRVAA
jgi:hypothetical protein